MNINKLKDEIYYTLKAYNGNDPKHNNQVAELIVEAILPIISTRYDDVLNYLHREQKDLDLFNDPSYPEFTRIKNNIESLIKGR